MAYYELRSTILTRTFQLFNPLNKSSASKILKSLSSTRPRDNTLCLRKLLKTFEYFKAFFLFCKTFKSWKPFKNQNFISVTEVTNSFQILSVTHVTLRSNVQEEQQQQFYGRRCFAHRLFAHVIFCPRHIFYPRVDRVCPRHILPTSSLPTLIFAHSKFKALSI